MKEPEDEAIRSLNAMLDLRTQLEDFSVCVRRRWDVLLLSMTLVVNSSLSFLSLAELE